MRPWIWFPLQPSCAAQLWGLSRRLRVQMGCGTRIVFGVWKIFGCLVRPPCAAQILCGLCGENHMLG